MIRAVFPGTFDPIHFGHMDIAQRASRMFDEVVVAVYDQPLKKLLFPPKLRISLVEEVLHSTPNIKVTGYSGLTVDYCHQINAQVIVRGLRVFSDFEYEFRMALANHSLAPDIDVVALITNKDHSFISGSTVREIAALGGDVSTMVPKIVEEALVKRFEELGSDQDIVPHNSLRD
jgi:pantetheine-phosphate adenylyltransferase